MTEVTQTCERITGGLRGTIGSSWRPISAIPTFGYLDVDLRHLNQIP
jgi:hypothetical protein